LDIRIATHQDVDHIADMAIGFRNHLERNTPSDTQFRTSVSDLLASGDAEFYLALENGHPIGYVLQRFRFSMWVSGIEATIEDLFVSPSQRRNGSGKRLIQFALDRAQAKGCSSVCLDTNENNVASTRIYTQLGFNSVSKRWHGRQLFLRLHFPAVSTSL
jgi:ribosomal protein S18 acetylase RimI-like enzyme